MTQILTCTATLHKSKSNYDTVSFQKGCTCKESQQFLPVFRNTGDPLKPLLQVMWTKMCCVCAIFPCNRLRRHYLHARQTQGSGLNYLPLCLPSLSPSKISFEGVLASLSCPPSSISDTEGQLAQRFSDLIYCAYN